MSKVSAKNQILRLGLFLSIALLAVVNFGCTKKVEVSRISLELPDWSKLNGIQPSQKGIGAMASTGVGADPAVMMIVINVTGSGINPPIYYVWQMTELDQQIGGKAPSQVSLNVPKGSDRMVQVLVAGSVPSDNGDSATSVYYGDTVQTLSAASESVIVNLERKSAGDEEGRIIGRYFSGVEKTPSGQVGMYLTLENKPPMLITRSSIFDGYFDLMVFSKELPVSFKMDTGEELLKNYHTDKELNTEAAFKIAIPESYQDQGGPQKYKRLASRVLLGFFGDSTAIQNKKACFPSYSSIPGYYRNLSDTNQLQWIPGSTDPNNARRIGSGGGLSVGTTICPTPDNGKTNLILSLEGLGSRSPLEFNGPFQRFQQGERKDFLHVINPNAGTVNIKWKYLPGIQNSVSGVGLFYKVGGSQYNEFHDETPCNDLATKYGYTKLLDVSRSLEEYTWSSAAAAMALQHGQLSVLACPYKEGTGRYYNFAIRNYGSSSSSNGGIQTATQIRVTGLHNPEDPSGTVKAYSSVCTGISARMVDGFGRTAFRKSLGAPRIYVKVNSTSNGPGYVTYLKFYDNESTCSTEQTPGYSGGYEYNLINGEALFYVKADIVGANNDYYIQFSDISQNDGGSTLPDTSFSFSSLHASPSPIPTPNELKVGNSLDEPVKSQITAWQCYPYSLIATGSSTFVTVPPSGGYSSIVLPSSSDLHFYNDSNCLDPYIGNQTPPLQNANSVEMKDTVSGLRLYYRYSGGGIGTISLKPPSLAPTPSPLITGVDAVTVVQPDPAVKYVVRGAGIPLGSSAEKGTCTEIHITSVNNSGQAVPIDLMNSKTITWNKSNVEFYSDYDCLGQESTTTIYANTPVTRRWIKWTNTMGIPIHGSLSGNDEDGNPVEPVTIRVDP